MKDKLLLGFFVLALVGFGLYSVDLAYAEDENAYLYVDIYGNLQTEVAKTPTEAIIDAENRTEHSGVVIVDQTPDTSDTLSDNEEETYAYIDIYGNLRTEVAETPTKAIIEAENRAEHSGVVLVSE